MYTKDFSHHQEFLTQARSALLNSSHFKPLVTSTARLPLSRLHKNLLLLEIEKQLAKLKEASIATES